jgi:DNA primase
MSSSSVEQIKARLSIGDVVGSYLKLEKAGGNFRARCPFHNERSPSFYVSPQRESYHCFGCNKGGDIFSFVQEIEGVDFIDALKMLADRAGVELVRENPQARTERERLLGIMHEAATFYEAALKRTPFALEYLRGRGLTDETIASFRIGFAPAAWRGLSDHLRGRGYGDDEVERAGLAVKRYDRFRSRIMFPLSNSSGNIVGFSGRIFEIPGSASPAGQTGIEPAKYVNTPQTVLYDKSKILYGFDRAKPAMRKEDKCILVEGQMDLLMSHQSGFQNTVAVSGTALTEEHLRTIKRLTNNLVMAFDPDDAGVKAAGRGAELALSLGMDVRVASHNEDLDPADLLLKDKNIWADAVQNSSHIITFFLKHLRAKHSDDRVFRKETEKHVMPYLIRLESKIEQAQYVSEVARALAVGEDPVWEELRRRAAQMETAKPVKSAESNVARAGPEENVRRRAVEERLYGILLWQGFTADEFKQIIGDAQYAYYDSLDEKEKSKYAFQAELAYKGCDKEFLIKEAKELYDSLREEILKEQLTSAMNELRRAEAAGDEEEVNRLIVNCRDAGNKLHEMKNKQIKQ